MGKIEDFRLGLSEITTGYGIWLLALIPAFMFTAALQILVEPSAIGQSTGVFEGNDAGFLNYVLISVIHQFFCATLIIYSIQRARRTGTPRSQRLRKSHMLLSIPILIGIIASCLSFFDWNIEVLSHQQVYERVIKTDAIAILMRPLVAAGTVFAFKAFSLIPMTSIFVAYSVVILVSFELASCMHSMDKADISNIDRFRDSMSVAVLELKWCFVRTLTVLVSSSVATAFYFGLAVVSGDAASADGYTPIANSMSLLWGAVFSMIMIFMFAKPVWRYQHRAIQLERTSAGYGPEITADIRKHNTPYFLLEVNVMYVLGCLMPWVSSAVGAMLSR